MPENTTMSEKFVDEVVNTEVNNDYQIAKPLDCPVVNTKRLAGLATRLRKFDDETQRKLINWGYAVSDLGLRQYVDGSITTESQFPYAENGV